MPGRARPRRASASAAPLVKKLFTQVHEMFARVRREFLGTSALSTRTTFVRRVRAVTARGAMPRPESFGVEEMIGNGNDNVPVKGDFRVRLAAAERARSTRPLLPLRVSPIVAPVEERRPRTRAARWQKVDQPRSRSRPSL